MRVNFKEYPASRKLTFTCASCGKKNRTKTVSHACTVNPFNTHADGTMLKPSEVYEQSKDLVQEECREFLAKPLCAKCEGSLGYVGRKELSSERKMLAAVQS